MSSPSTNTSEIAHPTVEGVTTAARDRLVIGLLLVSAFVVILNETIMGVAQPQIQEDLGIPYSAVQWLTTGFLLTMAIVIPTTGFLLKRFHTRTIFLTAMTLFTVGTFVCAVAPTFGILLAGRITQASGTAIMMPLLMTTVMMLVPPAARGRTMGNISIVISVAPAIGPTISGLVLNVLDWPWLFWLVLPIAGTALMLGAAKISNVTEPTRAPVDVTSILLSAFAFGGLIYGLSSLGEAARGHIIVPVWVPLVVGGVALLVFALRQLRLQRTDRALLDLRTFLSPVFTVSTTLLVVCMVALFGAIIVLPIYTQDVLGLQPLQTGLLLLPGGVLMGVLAPFVGRAYDRFGARTLVIPGSFVTSAALWSMTLLRVETPFHFVLIAHLTLSVGLALLFTPLFTSALGSLERGLYPHGSAIIGTVQQVGGAAGTALFITLMTARSVEMLAGGASEVIATAEGIQAAALGGGIASLFLVVGAFFIRTPKNAAAVPGGH
ncbi:DHA2 family efflux MFS transporter permease subunit [Salinibacterium sp. SYSU T00001]|uniref:MDR family MFS transporter n=1 Tax=Homoserinimonas sedimenticola TaxID=2986805 RepID=UPI002236A77B|nr:MDR family MFS transporter [Salinibacterium sedimenticola]MCW4384238.1 DHA2 family efflux MFS transporter permease subunit [Salinibacterium sedimenticola]